MGSMVDMGILTGHHQPRERLLLAQLELTAYPTFTTSKVVKRKKTRHL